MLAALLFGIFIYIKTSEIPTPSTNDISQYLESNDLRVGNQIVNDFQHIYYDLGRYRVSVTEGESNNVNPVTSGQYIAWISTGYGDNQRLVYLYDALSRITTQISFYGNASLLDIDSNRIVWQENVTGEPQVFYYDGHTVQQLGDRLPSLRPRIRGNSIVFAQYLAPDTYQSVLYDIDGGKTKVVSKGSASLAGWPQFKGEEITTNGPYHY